MSPLDRAKTRLADASSSPARHRALVRAMRRDTAQAVLGARAVSRLLVVTATPQAALADLQGLATTGAAARDGRCGAARDGRCGAARDGRCAAARDESSAAGPGRIRVIADPPHDSAHEGLNPAVAHAARHVAATWPEDAIAVVVADLPALTAHALDLVLAEAETLDLGVVLDRQGMGTTMLTAAPGRPVHPRFGPGSARRHLALGATRLLAPSSARTDVDVVDDLDAARRLGFGPAMAALFHAGELPLMPSGRHD